MCKVNINGGGSARRAKAVPTSVRTCGQTTLSLHPSKKGQQKDSVLPVLPLPSAKMLVPICRPHDMDTNKTISYKIISCGLDSSIWQKIAK